ncbi:MAG: ATP-binding protein, partial [Deltaproteobacteria bacterium]|nr:ATP-binding protein [Deltaproteobacteria bacterium]
DAPSPPKAEWIRLHWEQTRRQGDGALLIIDEIQKVPGWSEQVKILFDEDRGTRDIKIVLLGSSALYLQRGLSESLAGRFELLEAHHWSLKEFEEAFGWDFEKYFHFGAYPGTVGFADDEDRWRHYVLNSIIEPVLGKDILALHPINNPALFRQTFELAVQYPAQIISLQKMLGQLQDRGNAATIKNYLTLLEKSFLIKVLQKFSGAVIQTRASSPKIIVLNPALTHAYQTTRRLDTDSSWRGFMMESLVGAHLLRQPNTEIFYWRDGQAEVDYILKSPEGLLALEIQSGTRRKTNGLAAFSKQHPQARCESWNFQRCLEFMKTGNL